MFVAVNREVYHVLGIIRIDRLLHLSGKPEQAIMNAKQELFKLYA
jgi:hypothetical protein